MANSETGTSTGNILGGEYQVFLSFRGLDTRHSFTNSLHQALVEVGIRVFIDDEGLQHGDKISELFQAIDDSQLYIPIFSRNYASSHWCLDELAKMVENTSKHKEDGKKKVILPIFYNVKPSDVKLETSLYKDAILKQRKDQKRKLSSKHIKTWRRALKEIGGTKGWKLEELSPEKLIQDVVDTVIANRKTRRRRVTRDLVGMEDRIADIEELLDIDSCYDVRLIGIYGMGGIGKTTLAKIIFNKLSCQFGRNCSFLGDVRETEKNKGLVELQKRLLSNISKSRVAHDINDIEIGINTIEETICNKKVLIVLDDVDKADQIQKLIGEKPFCPGTRILVTTRNRGILNARELKYEFEKYEMEGLSSEDALRLFSKHAFDDDSPLTNYYTLSKDIVSTVDGLPLALQAIGSSLYGKERDIWEEMLQKLKEAPHDDVLVMLENSYDGLQWREQQIFLDIACFFAGKDKTNPMYMWKDCKFYPVSAIEVLINRCMIKELDNNSLWMHDQFKDLGRAIAKRERIGLWDEEDIIGELRTIKNKESFQALKFSASWGLRTVTSEQIKLFPDLRILWLSKVICQGDFTDCLSELRWIDLGYSFISPDRAGHNQRLEATNLLHLEKAVVVNLYGLDITEDVFQSLIEGARMKVLTIESNKSIRVHAPTTELGSLSQLKELTLHGLDLPTFEQLPSNLIVLKLYETRGKQEHFDGLPSLRKSRENKVCEQHDVQFPDVLESSERSSIQDCRSSERLVCQPEEPRCNEQQAPELIDHRREAFLFPGSLKKLKIFLLSGFPEVQDIQFVAAFESLEKFYIKECSSLKSLGGLSSLKNLKQLEIDQCPSLKVVEGIDELEFLHWLNIDQCGSAERIVDASSSKIPNKCSIRITRSGELPDSGYTYDTWESYREKIFYGTKQVSGSETEATDSETEMEDSL